MNPETRRHAFLLLAKLSLVAILAGALAYCATIAFEALASDGMPGIEPASHLGLLAFHIAIATTWCVVGVIAWVVAWRRWTLAAIVVGAVAGAAAYPLGEMAASGNWVSRQSWAWTIPWIVVAGAGFGGFMAFVISGLRRSSKTITIVIVTGGLLLLAMDAWIVPGLYPNLHLGLRFAAVGLLVLALSRQLVFDSTYRPHPLVVWGVVGLVVASVTLVFQLTGPIKSDLILRGGASSYLVGLFVEDESDGRLEMVLEGPNRESSDLYAPVKNDGAEVENAVLILVDTLRADAVPPARPPSGTKFSRPDDTPFLNEYLQSCKVYERVYAQSSATHRSIPPTFRSSMPWEPNAGLPLAHALTARGVDTGAVPTIYFYLPRYKSAQRLLLGFEVVNPYDYHHQDKTLTKTREVLDQMDGPFFMWIHMYAPHVPGFDDEGLISGGPHRELSALGAVA